MDVALSAQIARREGILDRLRQILIHDVGLDLDPAVMDRDAPLFAAGLGLESAMIPRLVAAIEATLGVALPDEGLRTGLYTLDTLTDLVIATAAAGAS
jgi:acyl carrier protein